MEIAGDCWISLETARYQWRLLEKTQETAGDNSRELETAMETDGYHWRQLETNGKSKPFLETTGDCWTLAARDHLRLLETARNHWRVLKAMGYHCRLLETIRDS